MYKFFTLRTLEPCLKSERLVSYINSFLFLIKPSLRRSSLDNINKTVKTLVNEDDSISEPRLERNLNAPQPLIIGYHLPNLSKHLVENGCIVVRQLTIAVKGGTVRRPQDD